ncbi:tetratricopeptide repeat protein [Arcticibacter sp.]|uniref:type IX secretion system periplasmic lipoprotein PorW/SprE n=1 Tax=Arcticibacter sp. TaxID=1872630 RepID=UPI00388E0B51
MPFTQNDLSKVDNCRSLQFSCYLVFLILLATGCASSQNANFQNLTSRFNIMYNAERLLGDYMNTGDVFVADDYSELLPVFRKLRKDRDTKLLDSVILKANSIIYNKAQSDFLDDAYFLIAEANFLKGNFFDAAEFYSYVYSTYPNDPELAQLSRINKARALMLLNNVSGATAVLDSAFKYAETSDNIHPDLFAWKTQLLIAQNQFDEAEYILSRALSARPDKLNRQRWTFLLAQLQEKNNKKHLALGNFKKLKKSFAPSDLNFHADINYLTLYSELYGNKVDKIQILRGLLDENRYIDFKDCIYYRIGKVQEQMIEMADALMSYRNSVKASSKNSNLKGLTYTSLADIHFKSGLYKRAQSYYDSALTYLPSSHSQYADIRKKSEGLNHLAEIFEKVDFEETLQRIAALPEDQRQHEVTELIRKRSYEEAEQLTASILPERDAEGGRADFFYFNNAKALTQGEIDFREKWGDKTLRDNWRYEASEGSTTEPTLSGTGPARTGMGIELPAGAGRRFEDYINNLPISQEAIEASNERIAASLYEIGMFYLNNLQDEQQASAALQRVADYLTGTSYALPAYYRLFLMKRRTEPLLANHYANIILSRYPQTEIADLIQHTASGSKDPAFTSADAIYTDIYSLFANKQYGEVIRQVETKREEKRSGNLSSQLDYLYLISMGHTQSPRAFEDSLQSFAFRYPKDSLVTPLVRQHLEYIRQNSESFSKRTVALLNNEMMGSDNSLPQIHMRETTPKIPKNAATPKDGNESGPVQQNPGASNTTLATKARVPHYFVVNILSATTNLSPSRFGIGQFNRSMYPQLAIKHQLKVVNKENQLIFVGPFQDKEEAQSYEARILPMIKTIMKIPEETYNSFVISQEGLERLNTREQIQAQIEHTTKNIK